MPCTQTKTYSLIDVSTNAVVPADLAFIEPGTLPGQIRAVAKTTNQSYVGVYQVVIRGEVDFTGSNPQTEDSPIFMITVVDQCECAAYSVLQEPAVSVLVPGDITINADDAPQSTVADGFTDSVSENAVCTPCTTPISYSLVYSATGAPVPPDLATV